MILSDREIRARLERGELVIDPLDDPELQVQPASVDLRLGARFIVYKLPHVPVIDPRRPASRPRARASTASSGTDGSDLTTMR